MKGEERTTHHNGFSLVEVAIVVVIFGIIMAAMAGSYAVYLQAANAKAVRVNMDTADKAIKEFLAVNGRLPCPARLTDLPDTATFGVESAANCSTAGVIAGAPESTNAATGLKVRIGMLPVRSLNLPDQYSQDSWKNRYRYAVTEVLATTGGYDPNNGAISVIDSNGNPAITNGAGAAAYAHYALISQGQDGIGAYSNSGNTTVACPAAGATKDRENCNDDYIFRKTSLASSPAGANHYDDYLTFASALTLQDTNCGDHGMIRGTSFVGNKDANGCLVDMRIYDNDRVGIGTGAVLTSPGGKLELGSTDAGFLGLLIHDASGNGNSRTWALGNAYGGAGYGTLGFYVGSAADGAPASTPVVVIDKSGSVGIGTPAPNPWLPLTIRASSSVPWEPIFGFEDATGALRWHFNRGDPTLARRGLNLAETAVADGRLFIQEGGNVGIGTMAPAMNLDIIGAAQASTSFNSPVFRV